jgi:DNA-binding CsgD family transcriptional regulator/pimeloyl-ACP methyl ester carboxylesterase
MDAPPVQYVSTSDGYNIAFSVCGKGRPFVFVPPNFTDIQLAWRLHAEWIEGLASRFRLIQFDSRGEGLSTRGLPNNLSMADMAPDLAAVADRLALGRFVVWGFGGRCHVALRYALDHPDRVEALILDACPVGDAGVPHALFVMLPRENWDFFLGSLCPPGIASEARRAMVDDFRRCVTLEDFNAWIQALAASDLSDELPQIRTPVLVMHPRDFTLPESQASMNVAALIPGARFIHLDGDSLFGNAAQGLRAIDAFLAETPHIPESGETSDNRLSTRELEVLRLLARGKSNQQIADELVLSINTVRRHVSNIFDKTGVANRAQAVAYARDHGIG